MMAGLDIMRREERWIPRAALAGGAVLLVAGGAVAAALLSATLSGSLTGSVESASAGSATVLARAASVLPLGYAFGAGMLAAVNPCGFALLPAYLGLYLGDEGVPAIRRTCGALGARLLRAVQVSVLVTAGFVALFSVAGLAVGVVATFAHAFPWLGLAVGLLFVLAGGATLGGGTLPIGPGGRLASRLGGRARMAGGRSYLVYGLAYGLASLGCTLPIFLAVVGSALAAGGAPAVVSQFVLYALGMGAILTLLTLGTALFQVAAIRVVGQAGRYLEPLGAILLLLAGGYLIYYWLTLGGLLAQIRAS